MDVTASSADGPGAGAAPGEIRTIGILGGTGKLGSGLARRWARAGYRVLVGSRDGGRADEAARKLRESVPRGAGNGIEVSGTDNARAAAAADVAVLTVPYRHHLEALRPVRDALAGRILVDATAPVQPPDVGTVRLPAAGSAAQAARDCLGERVRVVSAFQTVAAKLLRGDGPLDGDVLVAGDDREACEVVVGLVNATGLRGLYAGPLANAAAAEALTSVLIHVNRQYKCHAGIRITGLEARGR